MTILLAGVSPDQLRIAVSPLAELGACLHALTESEHHPLSARWAQHAGECAPPDLLVDARRFAPLWSAYRARVFYPYGARLPTTGGDLAVELAALATMPIEPFTTLVTWACVGGYSRWTPSGAHHLPAAVPATDPMELAAALSTTRAELLERLHTDPVRLRRDLVDFLGRAGESIFAGHWESARPVLAAEARRLHIVVREHGLLTALGRLPGTRVQTDPDRVTVGKFSHQLVDASRRGLWLIPTVYGHPHFLVKAEPGQIPVIQFPVQATATMPVDQTMRRVQALATPTRWALCRLIAREALPPTEIARRTRMTVPQVSRHLRVLRSIGLVQVSATGRHRYYRLDMSALVHLGPDVVSALFA